MTFVLAIFISCCRYSSRTVSGVTVGVAFALLVGGFLVRVCFGMVPAVMAVVMGAWTRRGAGGRE